MNKRLIHRAMQKMVDQNPSRPLPIPVTRIDTTPSLTDAATTTLIGHSAEAEEAMAARIREDIARAQALREQRERERQAAQNGQVPTLGAASVLSPSSATLPSGQDLFAPTGAPSLPGTAQTGTPTGTVQTGPAQTGTLTGVLSNTLPDAPSGDTQPGVQTSPFPGGLFSATPSQAAPQRPGGQRPVQTLDFESLKARGFLSPDDKTAKIHQEFRLVKRRLLDNAFGRLRPVVDNGRLIMVTSSLPGEGKTFSAINLAISIAIGGEHPVLLLDADIARPSVANTLELDIPDEMGLTDYLENPSIPVTDLLLPTSLPELTLLPAGHLKHRPVDLLASGNMARLIETLKTMLPHHVIVVDSPPLLPVTETRSLTALVGQVMLVVAAGETPRSAVNESLLQLENCPAVGLLFNKAPVQPKAPAYYGY